MKFAVVREDPRTEIDVARRVGARSALVVASGGCTAFALAEALPDLRVTLYDFNPDQLAHVEARAQAIARGDLRALDVGAAPSTGLSQCGDFERLFRVLRTAIVELVAPVEALEDWFAADAPDRGALEGWLASPYWPAVFHVAFNDALLVAMFGPDAVQHATPGSYPGYFQWVFEGGLRRPDAPHNPFLQHVLLGRYLPRDAPSFLRSGARFAFESVLGGLPDIPDLHRFDLVHLSNIYDWSDDAAVGAWCAALRRLHPGAAITLRQLNNQRDVRRFLAPWFTFDDALGKRLLAEDRSLFYERIEVGTRTEVPA